jgi:hypothetical protein
MVDRRRSPRLAFSRPQRARIRTVQESVVARRDGHSVEVTTSQPAACGERLVLQFTTATGEVSTDVTVVVSCTPHACHDGMQWRLLLSLAAIDHLDAQPAG